MTSGPRLFEQTFPTPAENLACDEALLDEAEAGRGSAVLRFWEAARPFVVLGFANKLQEEVNETACRNLGVPILRRCSGGGTVVQGPGCLNYALILPAGETGPLRNVTSTNAFVMQRHQQALTALVRREITVEGVTDLAIGQLKFSGNAQRRRREWLLFHGTFLYGFDLEWIPQLLLQPPRQPSYRLSRPHQEFVTLLPANRSAIQKALSDAWQAGSGEVELPATVVATLAAEKYAKEAWTRRC